MIQDKTASVGTLPIEASPIPSNLSNKIGQALTPLKHPAPDLSYAMRTESIQASPKPQKVHHTPGRSMNKNKKFNVQVDKGSKSPGVRPRKTEQIKLVSRNNTEGLSTGFNVGN